MTIFGAVMMVGSPENGGVLDKAVDRFSARPEAVAGDAREFAEAPHENIESADPSAGWGSSSPSMFGDYRPEDTTPESDASTDSEPVRTNHRQPQGLVPGPQPVIADNVGIPVPGPDDLP